MDAHRTLPLAVFVAVLASAPIESDGGAPVFTAGPTAAGSTAASTDGVDEGTASVATTNAGEEATSTGTAMGTGWNPGDDDDGPGPGTGTLDEGTTGTSSGDAGTGGAIQTGEASTGMSTWAGPTTTGGDELDALRRRAAAWTFMNGSSSNGNDMCDADCGFIDDADLRDFCNGDCAAGSSAVGVGARVLDESEARR